MSQSGSSADHGGDLAWAKALAGHDPEALTRYEREVAPRITAQLRSRGHTDDEINDVQQALRARLFVGNEDAGPAIAAYAGRGKLVAFALVAALREAVRLRERSRREPAKAEDVLLALADRAAPPELDPSKERYRELFRTAFRTALAALAPRARTMLRLHLIDELSILQISALMGVHRVTAARWIDDARDAIARDVRRDLGARLGADRFEVDDLLGWVRSRIELSLSGLATSTK